MGNEKTGIRRIHKSETLIEGVRHVNAKTLAMTLGTNEYTIRRLAREGKLPYHKIGVKLWFDPERVKSHIRHEERPKQLSIPTIDYEGLKGF